MKYAVCVDSQNVRYIIQGEVYNYINCIDSKYVVVDGYTYARDRFVFLKSNKINNILYGVPYGK